MTAVIKPLECMALAALDEFEDLLGSFACKMMGGIVSPFCPERVGCSYCNLARHCHEIRRELKSQLEKLTG
jgi:hypothetical protein